MNTVEMVLANPEVQVESNGVIMRHCSFEGPGAVEIVADPSLFDALQPIEGRFKRTLVSGWDPEKKVSVTYYCYVGSGDEAQALYDRAVKEAAA
jgi:hypothetical protein